MMTPTQWQGHVMLLRCEQPLDKLQSKYGYVYQNLKRKVSLRTVLSRDCTTGRFIYTGGLPGSALASVPR